MHKAPLGNATNALQFDIFLAHKVNQDVLENLFSIIRQKDSSCDGPMPITFSRIFRQVTHSSTAANCEQDFDKPMIITNLLIKKRSEYK